MFTSTTPSQTPASYPHDKGRFKIIIAYWTVLIVAAPVWWVLTTVQRLPLPVAQVKEVGSKHIRIPIDVNVDVTDGLCDATTLAAKLQIAWDKTHGTEPSDIWSVLDVRMGALGSHRPDISHAVYNITVRYGYDNDPAIVHDRSFEVFSRSGCDGQLVDKVSSSLRALLTPPTHNTELRVAQYSPRYRLAFSLLNEDASFGGAVSSWTVERAIKEYLQPTLNELNILHNFTIESQVQFYAPLTTEPVPAQDGYALNQEQLTIFVNSAEWSLSSSVSNDPVLHFVLFVPSLARRPLYIQDSQGKITQFNSFLVPQWGGIAILNPTFKGSENLVLAPHDLKPIFHTFRRQLEGLLGVPALPPPVGLRLDRGIDSKQVLSGWQLDTLLRRRALENIQGSVQTLNSIVGLAGQIENMPVGPSVRDDVLSALDELSQTHNATHPTQTLTHSALSLQLASRAFFNPNMVGLLYFPAEHKYAVYTPLFAPIAVPLVVSVIRELKSRPACDQDDRREDALRRPAGSPIDLVPPPFGGISSALEMGELDPALATLDISHLIEPVTEIQANISVERACEVLLEKKEWCVAVMTQAAGAQPVCTGLFDFSDANAYMHLAVTANSLTPEDLQNDRISQIVSSARLRKEVPVELACNLSEKNPLVMLRNDTSLTTLLEIFSRGTHRVLVEGPEQQVKGIITDSALVKYFASNHDKITTSPVITQVIYTSLLDLGVITPPPIVSASPDSTVLDAMTLMSREGVSSIAVLHPGPDIGVLISTVTVTDIGQLVIPSESKSVLSMKLGAFVSDIKNPHGMINGEDLYPVYSVLPTSTLGYTIEKLLATKVHRVFVADEPEPSSPPFGQGNLKGVVSLVDILAVFARHLGIEANPGLIYIY
ncbi:unnamed protein product [Rhizoctonia solani]|uniref:CBS domain-containing protein n=1 Tax=Rhizoctonia solani TaxID=456999 RepID=A0A8H3D9U9_9AGAM|nr:unnamed protein product [Rhizoctonia solani]